MDQNELKMTMRQLRVRYPKMSQRQKLEAAQLLFDTACDFARQLRSEVHENDAKAKRRKAKRRETEVDPKPPVKPVSVAEPSKPKKAKYNGL